MLTNARATLVQSCSCILYLTIHKLYSGMKRTVGKLSCIHIQRSSWLWRGEGWRQYAHATNIHDL